MIFSWFKIPLRTVTGPPQRSPSITKNKQAREMQRAS